MLAFGLCITSFTKASAKRIFQKVYHIFSEDVGAFSEDIVFSGTKQNFNCIANAKHENITAAARIYIRTTQKIALSGSEQIPIPKISNHPLKKKQALVHYLYNQISETEKSCQDAQLLYALHLEQCVSAFTLYNEPSK